VCPVGKYTFLAAAEKCEECISDSDCEGGDQVKVQKGYWRQFLNSTDVF